LEAWNKEAEIFNAKEGDKNFDKVSKVKEKFAFSTEEKPLTKEELEKNFELMSIYKDANYFEVETKTTTNLNNTKPTAEPIVGKGKYYGYETPEALAAGD